MARRAVIAAVVATLVLGAAGAGSGFVDGDAAVWAAQGWAGDLADRPVHVLYVALSVALAPVAGGRLPLALDLVSVACAAGVVALVGRAGGAVAAVVCAALVVPHASFGEVDLPWLALGVAAAVGPRAAAPALAALAVLVSPAALLALPAGAWLRARTDAGRDPSWADVARAAGWLGVGAVGAVVVVSACTHGWWTGERGVLAGPPWRPGRTAAALWGDGVPLAALPLVVLGRPGPAAVLLVPLVLAPPDVPVGLVVGVGCALLAARGAVRAPPRLVVALLAVQAVAGAAAWGAAVGRVRAEDDAIAATVAAMAPGDVLVATWTFGARASVTATRDPYALPWRVPGAPVRDQSRWCRVAPRRVWVLPPDLPVTWDALPGCDRPARRDEL